MSEMPTLAAGMIDSHFHALEMHNRDQPVRDILAECFDAGMEFAVDVGTEHGDFESRLALVEQYDCVLLTVGLSPEQAEQELEPDRLDHLQALLGHPRVVAIGETGLDWYWDYGTRMRQIELFRAQAEIADRNHVPLIIHNRDADREVLDVLRTVRPSAGGVLHCFSSDYDTAKDAIDLGFFVSFAGNVTFKNATSLQEVARRLPDNCILVETDAPYLAPHPLRGRPNHPGLIGHTFERLAALRCTPVRELIDTVKDNFTRAFPSAATRRE